MHHMRAFLRRAGQRNNPGLHGGRIRADGTVSLVLPFHELPYLVRAQRQELLHGIVKIRAALLLLQVLAPGPFRAYRIIHCPCSFCRVLHTGLGHVLSNVMSNVMGRAALCGKGRLQKAGHDCGLGSIVRQGRGKKHAGQDGSRKGGTEDPFCRLHRLLHRHHSLASSHQVSSVIMQISSSMYSGCCLINF